MKNRPLHPPPLIFFFGLYNSLHYKIHTLKIIQVRVPERTQKWSESINTLKFCVKTAIELISLSGFNYPKLTPRFPCVLT